MDVNGLRNLGPSEGPFPLSDELIEEDLSLFVPMKTVDPGPCDGLSFEPKGKPKRLPWCDLNVLTPRLNVTILFLGIEPLNTSRFLPSARDLLV